MGIIVKHSYIKSGPTSKQHGHAHLRYLRFRPGTDRCPRDFFDGVRDAVPWHIVHDSLDIETDPYVTIHKLIISCDFAVDRRKLIRHLMGELGCSAELTLRWFAVTHDHTDEPHVHVVIMPTDSNGKQVRFFIQHYKLLRAIGAGYLISDPGTQTA